MVPARCAHLRPVPSRPSRCRTRVAVTATPRPPLHRQIVLRHGIIASAECPTFVFAPELGHRRVALPPPSAFFVRTRGAPSVGVDHGRWPAGHEDCGARRSRHPPWPVPAATSRGIAIGRSSLQRRGADRLRLHACQRLEAILRPAWSGPGVSRSSSAGGGRADWAAPRGHSAGECPSSARPRRGGPRHPPPAIAPHDSQSTRTSDRQDQRRPTPDGRLGDVAFAGPRRSRSRLGTHPPGRLIRRRQARRLLIVTVGASIGSPGASGLAPTHARGPVGGGASLWMESITGDSFGPHR